MATTVPIRSGDKGVRNIPSCSSLSSEQTLVDDSTVSPHKQIAGNEESRQEETICWRPKELLDHRHRPDSLFFKYCLFNEEYAQLNGLEPPSQRHSLPISKFRELSRSQILEKAPETIAWKLSESSLEEFRKVPYNEIIREAFLEAFGISSDFIDSYFFEYKALEVRMYSIFIGGPVKRLSDILKELKEREADPFVSAAIEHALERVISRRKGRIGLRYVKAQDLTQSLDTQLRKSLHLITKPFKELLSKPDTAQNILEELEVLRTRFYNFYMPLNVDWNCLLDTKNDLLEQIRWVDIPTIARAISKKAKALFSKYLRSALAREGDEAQSILNKEWDILSEGVKEIVAANIGLCSQMDTLANCLYRFRNYYSLTAVIQGIQASGYRTVALKTFGYLLNPKDDYRTYLMEMNIKGALHFLFPALLQYQRGEPMFMEMAVDAFKFYTLDAYQSTPGMQLTPLDIATAATKASYSTGRKESSLDCSFVSCFVVSFRF